MAAKKPMTKAQMTDHIAKVSGLTKKAANEIIDQVAAIAYKEVKKNAQFTLPGLGKLVLVRQKARKGRNPATGEEIKIPAKRAVKFRVAKACKDAVLGAKK